MSARLACAGCVLGNHDEHDPSWGLRPGLIGGWYCACTGDCKERFDAMAVRLLTEFGMLPERDPEPLPPYVTRLSWNPLGPS